MQNQNNENKARDGGFNDSLGNSKDNSFFCENEVEKGGCGAIEERFETLILRNCKKPFDWYKSLGLDKSYASKIRRGLIIPPLWLRIKIAQYFKTDSSLIWRYQDLNVIKELSGIKRNISLSQTFVDGKSDVYREQNELNQKRKQEGF